ncbi:hypothetical protein LCGC14_1347720 [marine sediment metagenome]|uniref:Uncharacterized protein n=1 Tax=marine sediment metagenome TaxID=412755 RepID=A0A0F9KCD3_9ZZZZ
MKCAYCSFSVKFAGRMQIWAKTWYEDMAAKLEGVEIVEFELKEIENATG